MLLEMFCGVGLSCTPRNNRPSMIFAAKNLSSKVFLPVIISCQPAWLLLGTSIGSSFC